MSISLTALTLLVLGLSSPAQLSDGERLGQGLQSRQTQGQMHTPEGMVFVGGFASPGGTERDVIEFFSLPDRGRAGGERPASVPVARKVHETADGQGEAVWADGRPVAACTR